MHYNLSDIGITYYNVSNMDSDAIDKARKHCMLLLSKINKTYNGIEGSKRNQTITFLVDLTEEEADIIERNKL